MPVLNWQPCGEKTEGPAWLRRYGPRISVEISVHIVVQKALISTGQPVPQPVAGQALIDTGASISAIDISVAKQLGLQPVGKRKLGCAAGATEADTFPFTIQIVPGGPNLNCMPGVGADIKAQGIIALIGMDLIGQGVLIVNGLAATYTWAF